MREIKFRIWLPKRDDDKALMYYFKMFQLGGAVRDDAVVMQYTGLKDRNKIEIYEGDIVTASWHWETPHVFEFPGDFYDIYEYAIGDELIVIGNQFENPELLKGN